MIDLISRDDLYHDMTIKRLELHEKGISWSEFCRGFGFAMEFVKQAPSAQPEWKWTPVSERLPEVGQRVLITHKGGVSFGWHNGSYFERGASTYHRKLETVVAWMPLPEPANIGDGK